MWCEKHRNRHQTRFCMMGSKKTQEMTPFWTTAAILNSYDFKRCLPLWYVLHLYKVDIEQLEYSYHDLQFLPYFGHVALRLKGIMKFQKKAF